MKVLVTGAQGLIGSSLVPHLQTNGVDVVALDLATSCNVLVKDDLEQAMEGCDGVIHLAAVSRVVWGQKHPNWCWDVNVNGLENVLQVAANLPMKPWVLFASSREVYGQAESFPVTEEYALKPVNVYGKSKKAGEQMVNTARNSGHRIGILRLSNVWGAVSDHSDRVIPAFVCQAIEGRPLKVEGGQCTFDFTHVNDVVQGIYCCASLLQNEASSTLPPIQLVTGVPTTLDSLAESVIDLSESKSIRETCSPRNFDVSAFWGSYSRAKDLLGWEPKNSLREGLVQFIQDCRKEFPSHPAEFHISVANNHHENSKSHSRVSSIL